MAQKMFREGKTQDKTSITYPVERPNIGYWYGYWIEYWRDWMLLLEIQSILYILEQITQWTVNFRADFRGQYSFYCKNSRIKIINDIRILTLFNSFHMGILSLRLIVRCHDYKVSFSSILLLSHALSCLKFHEGPFHTTSNERSKIWKGSMLAVLK